MIRVKVILCLLARKQEILNVWHIQLFMLMIIANPKVIEVPFALLLINSLDFLSALFDNKLWKTHQKCLSLEYCEGLGGILPHN